MKDRFSQAGQERQASELYLYTLYFCTLFSEPPHCPLVVRQQRRHLFKDLCVVRIDPITLAWGKQLMFNQLRLHRTLSKLFISIHRSRYDRWFTIVTCSKPKYPLSP